MKTTYFVLLVFCLGIIPMAVSLDPTKNTTFKEHLLEINKTWNFFSASIPTGKVAFVNDVERIQLHLTLVEKHLRANAPAHLSPDQLHARNQTLNSLANYAKSASFPVNSFHAVRQPYFIDIHNTYCAVGFLLKETGYDAIALDIAKHQNYAYVPDIVSPELVKWSEDFGFDLRELAWIQPAYAPQEAYANLENGTNGVVHYSITDNLQNGKWYFAGEFDSLNGLPCMQVGVFANNQLECLGNGIAGTINGIGLGWSNGSYFTRAAGSFSSAGRIYPIAQFNGTSWSYDSIPNRPNAVASAFFSNSYSMKVAIESPSTAGEQEIWSNIQSVWTLEAIVKGKVHSMLSEYSVYAGEFDSIKIVSNNTWYVTKNVLANFSGWKTMFGDVPEVVNTVKSNGQSLYLGGTYKSVANPNAVLLARYLNGSVQRLLKVDDFTFSPTYSVNALEFYDADELLVGGSFNGDFMMYYGKNLLKYNLVSGYFDMMGLFNEGVNTIGKMSNIYYLGGSFTNPSTVNNVPLNRLARHDSKLSIVPTEEVTRLEVFPNPSSDKFELKGDALDLVTEVTVTDLLGKIWLRTATPHGIFDVSMLPAGMYTIRCAYMNRAPEVIKWQKIP